MTLFPPAMPPKVLHALEKQADHERFASASYLAMHHWCEVNDYSGFAEFFQLQSREETSHANRIYAHLVDRDIVPKMGPIEAPRLEFASLVEIAEAALALEKANTVGIHAAYTTALEECDYPAQVLLHWFINEQVEEEAWADKMVGKTKAATCAGALVYLDRHIVKELVGKSED